MYKTFHHSHPHKIIKDEVYFTFPLTNQRQRRRRQQIEIRQFNQTIPKMRKKYKIKSGKLSANLFFIFKLLIWERMNEWVSLYLQSGWKKSFWLCYLPLSSYAQWEGFFFFWAIKKTPDGLISHFLLFFFYLEWQLRNNPTNKNEIFLKISNSNV